MNANKRFSLSRYAIPFHRDGQYLIFSSKTCNFYKLEKEGYDYVCDFKDIAKEPEDSDEEAMLEDMRSKGLMIYPGEDEDYVERLRFLNNITSFSKSSVALTVTPTLCCNLRCPYCFEENKPAGIMTQEVMDATVEYVKSCSDAKWLDITWFGGEPLLCPDIIESLLDRFSALEDIKLREHTIITNGTLLNKRAVEIFKRYPLSSMQITLDGVRSRHNTKRFYADGKGTFDDILGNLDAFVKECPKTNINIRVNVDNQNRNDFKEIKRLISERFPKNNVSTYPGILRANKGCESEVFFTSKDHLEFLREIKGDAPDNFLFPRLETKGCCAICASAHVVGPRGELYRCWEHVGKPQYEVGNIVDKNMKGERILMQYINHGTPFADEECLKCSLLPICNGGCPFRRISNLELGENNDLCSLYKSDDGKSLEDVLFEYYTNKQLIHSN